MAKTEVILIENVVGLGAESDHVKVAAGYARNYLLPHRLAIPLTAANKKRLEALQKRRAEREAHEYNATSELAKSLSKLVCLVKVKTGDDGKMFGSVTPGTISDELKNQFDIAIDKRKIHLESPIRNLGDFDVELHLHAQVPCTLKVRVESTTPLPPPEETAADSKEGAPRRGGRGRGERSPRGVRTEKSAPAEASAKPEKAGKTAAKTSRPARS